MAASGAATGRAEKREPRPHFRSSFESVKFVDLYRECWHAAAMTKDAGEGGTRRSRGYQLRPVALFAACLGLLTSAVIVANEGAATAAAAPAVPDAAGVTWLCQPGQPGDPCLYPRGANSVTASGVKTAVPAAPTPRPPSIASTCTPP